MQDSVFSPPIALPPFSKRSPIKSGDFSNATVELVKLVRRKLVSVPLWHKLLFLKGVNLDLGILVMRLPTTQIACLGQLNVSVPLRGFWYADANCFKPHGGSIYRFSPLTGILVRRRKATENIWLFPDRTRFSPLTGILVRRLCLSVPAPRLGSQAIFSNLRLFSSFSGTQVKNKNQAMAIIGLVTPFVAILEIFKPTGFLALK